MQTQTEKQKTTPVDFEIVNLDEAQHSRARAIMQEISSCKRVRFTLALASTEMSDIAGLSAAGADAAAMRLTPKLDAEALLMGLSADKKPLPVSPAGITSPVIITRACLSLLDHKLQIVDCGSFQPPQIDHISLLPAGQKSGQGANFISQDSMDLRRVDQLFNDGLKLGRRSNGENYLNVIGECVPGGTTTALALLKALGLEADNMLSSSIHRSLVTAGGKSKCEYVNEGLSRIFERCGREQWQEKILRDPLIAVAAVGDPMQAFVSGFVIGLLDSSESDAARAIVLAGGSQMLAVYALIRAITLCKTSSPRQSNSDSIELDWPKLNTLVKERLTVITTKWVAHDPFADTITLAQIVDAPYVASSLNFSKSRHPGLRAYEDGHVKEGVGAGAALVLAQMLGAGNAAERQESTAQDRIIATIESYYEAMTDRP